MVEKVGDAPVVIIGGGAAGIFAAIGAGEKGVPVMLVEKNKQLGLKLLITGKGRSNLTNTAPIGSFIQQFSEHGRFLYSALANLSNKDLMTFFNRIGVGLKEERGGRVFPISDRSKDVVNALSRYLRQLSVDMKLETEALGPVYQNGMVTGVQYEGGILPAKSVVIATGGLSYPRTGSTGDGYDWARKAGHRVTKLRPSLIGLETEEKWTGGLSGLTLKNVKVTALGREQLGEQFGELLFTHFGVSGPVILTLSRAVTKELEKGPVRLRINLKPALDETILDKRIVRDFEKFSNKTLKNALVDLLPLALIGPVLDASGLDPFMVVHQVTKAQRQKIGGALQSLSLSITRPRPIQEAIVTSGGICLKEINPKTMASKILPNLFFAGEILDVDGFTGGYNLQAAFSTGYLAGQSAAVFEGS